MALYTSGGIRAWPVCLPASLPHVPTVCCCSITRCSAYNAVADERDDDPRFWGRGADHPGRGGLGGRRRHPEEEAEEPEEAEDEAEVRRRLQAKEKQRREREAAAWERHRAEGGGDEGRSGRHVGASGGGSGSRRDVAPAGAGGKTRGKDQPPDYSALIPGGAAIGAEAAASAMERMLVGHLAKDRKGDCSVCIIPAALLPSPQPPQQTS